MGKYAPLTRFLREREEHSVTLSFAELEDILGFSLPESAYRYQSWWANSASGQSQIRGWKDAGWETRGVDLSGRKVTFVRVSGEPVANPAAVPRTSEPKASPAPRPGATSANAPARKQPGKVGLGAETTLAPAVDVTKLPPWARRLLDSRARANNRKAQAEAAAILNAALAEERARLILALAEMRGRTRRAGAFDLLTALGRKRA